MAFDDFSKKFRFSFLVPYGIVSPTALALTVYQESSDQDNPNDIASLVYDPAILMTQRAAQCDRVNNTRTRRIASMVQSGWLRDKEISYGKYGWQTAKGLLPTQATLFHLTSTLPYAQESAPPQTESPDGQTIDTQQPQEETAQGELNRIPKRKKQKPQNLTVLNAMADLNELALYKDESPEDLELFRKCLLFSVANYDFTPLALEPELARSVNLIPTNRAVMLYRDLRLSNIEALFRVNNFLTSIDRRPMETVPPPRIEELNRIDMNDFSRHVLHKWYTENPDFFRFFQTVPNKEYQEAWAATPAFYAVHEIPELTMKLTEEKTEAEMAGMNFHGAHQYLRHTCAGIAIGKRENYIVHHTRASETPWYVGIENNTKMCAEIVLRKLNAKQPFMGGTRHFRNAIMVCSTIYQFAELFKKDEILPSSRWHGEKKVSAPYDNVNIVLLNPSGATQLLYLMSTNPIIYDDLLKRNLLTHEGFTERPKSGKRQDDIFALSYNRTPVLLAYSLNWNNLYWAKEKYDNGMKFYVCCYPEQAKYIRKIMPEVEFL